MSNTNPEKSKTPEEYNLLIEQEKGEAEVNRLITMARKAVNSGARNYAIRTLWNDYGIGDPKY